MLQNTFKSLNLHLENTYKSRIFWGVGGGGGGGGGGECQRIKVLRSRVYPLGQLPTIKFSVIVTSDQ